jgi:hypothetical protein
MMAEKRSGEVMFTITEDRLIEGLTRLGERHCQYAGGEWISRRCDCKFGASFKGEQTGCPELRQAIEAIRELARLRRIEQAAREVDEAGYEPEDANYPDDRFLAAMVALHAALLEDRSDG